MSLFKKDGFANWYVPKKAPKAGIGSTLRVYNTKRRHTVSVGFKFLEALGMKAPHHSDTWKVKAAFEFSDESPFVTFEPKEGVPFVILKASGNNKSPFISSKDLVNEFVKRFDLNSRCSYYDFTLTYWQTFRDMKLYKIELVQSVDCE